jgi:uncharacterized protein YukE
MDQPENRPDLTDEFRALGENLARTLNAFWDSPERKKLQEEIESGLTELAATLRGEAEAFQQSPAAQQFKSDVEDIRQRVQSGEAAEKAREELLKVLKTINTELDKVASRWRGEDRA